MFFQFVNTFVSGVSHLHTKTYTFTFQKRLNNTYIISFSLYQPKKIVFNMSFGSNNLFCTYFYDIHFIQVNSYCLSKQDLVFKLRELL